MNDREVAKALHDVSYEVESSEGYTDEEFTSFEFMPEDYQNILVKVAANLRERGVINEG